MTRPRDVPPERFDLDATIPRLEKLVNSPREFEWRQALVESVESIRKSHHRLDKQMVELSATVKHRMLGPEAIAKIAQAEIASEKLKGFEKIKWILVGAGVSLLVTILGAVLVKWLMK